MQGLREHCHRLLLPVAELTSSHVATCPSSLVVRGRGDICGVLLSHMSCIVLSCVYLYVPLLRVFLSGCPLHNNLLFISLDPLFHPLCILYTNCDHSPFSAEIQSAMMLQSNARRHGCVPFHGFLSSTVCLQSLTHHTRLLVTVSWLHGATNESSTISRRHSLECKYNVQQFV